MNRNLKISLADKNKTRETFDSFLPSEHFILLVQKSDCTRSICVTKSLAVIVKAE